MRDLEFCCSVWSRKATEKALARLDNPTCELTTDIPRAALERAIKKKQRLTQEMNKAVKQLRRNDSMYE